MQPLSPLATPRYLRNYGCFQASMPMASPTGVGEPKTVRKLVAILAANKAVHTFQPKQSDMEISDMDSPSATKPLAPSRPAPRRRGVGAAAPPDQRLLHGGQVGVEGVPPLSPEPAHNRRVSFQRAALGIEPPVPRAGLDRTSKAAPGKDPDRLPRRKAAVVPEVTSDGASESSQSGHHGRDAARSHGEVTRRGRQSPRSRGGAAAASEADPEGPQVPSDYAGEAVLTQLQPRWQQQQQHQQPGPHNAGAPSPPPPPPMCSQMGPPASSVMSGWGLAGGQPQMNSVYRLIRKKELQHNHHNYHSRHQQLDDAPKASSRGGGGGDGPPVPAAPPRAHQPSGRGPLQSPPRGPRHSREASPRRGDLQPRWQQQKQEQQKQLREPPSRQDQDQDLQHGSRQQGDPRHGHDQPPERSWKRPRQWTGPRPSERPHELAWDTGPQPRAPSVPPAPPERPELVEPAAFSSGHPAVDRVVRIRQIQMRRRQQQRLQDTADGSTDGVGEDSHHHHHPYARGGTPPIGGQASRSVARPADGRGVYRDVAAPVAPREGAWAAETVPTALLGGREGAVWGTSSGRQARASSGRGGRGDGSGLDSTGAGVIEVTLAGPAEGVPPAAGSDGGGGEGDGGGISGLLRETLISDLSLMNPVYRMIRKHELLQRRPGQPFRAPSSSASPGPSSASSPTASTDPWVTDDFADVMLGGLMLPPPPSPSGAAPWPTTGSEPMPFDRDRRSWQRSLGRTRLDLKGGGEGGAPAGDQEIPGGAAGNGRSGSGGGKVAQVHVDVDQANGVEYEEYGEDDQGQDGEEQQPQPQHVEAGRLNPVLRLIRKKQLQRRLRLRGRLVPEPSPAVTTATGAGRARDPTGGPSWIAGVGSSDEQPGGDGLPEAPAAAVARDAEDLRWQIGPEDAVGGRAVLNPVYRLIRKKQLQNKRASREAAAAASNLPAAAATTPGQGDVTIASGARAPSGASAVDAGWPGPRAPFFNLGLHLGSISNPAATLAEALDPMQGVSLLRSRFGAGASAAPANAQELVIGAADDSTGEADAAATRGGGDDDAAGAAVPAAPLPRPTPTPTLTPAPTPVGSPSRVSDELVASMVGERPHMNHVYRLIRKKELQLRQRGLLPRQGLPSGPPEGSNDSLKAPGAAGEKSGPGTGATAAPPAAATATMPPLLLPVWHGTVSSVAGGTAAAAAAARSPAEPPALLHPFDPVDETDSADPALAAYGSLLLLGDTYEAYDDELPGDDEGAYWSAEEFTWWDEGGEQDTGPARLGQSLGVATSPPEPAKTSEAPGDEAELGSPAIGAAAAATAATGKPRETAWATPAAGSQPADRDRDAELTSHQDHPDQPRRHRGRRKLAAAGTVQENVNPLAHGSEVAVQQEATTEDALARGTERKAGGHLYRQKTRVRFRGRDTGGAAQPSAVRRGAASMARRRRIEELKASLREKLLQLVAYGSRSAPAAAVTPTGGQGRDFGAAVRQAAGDATDAASAEARGDAAWSAAPTGAAGEAVMLQPRVLGIAATATADVGRDPGSTESTRSVCEVAGGLEPAGYRKGSDGQRRQHLEPPALGSGAAAVTARPLPWQLARRSSGGGAETDIRLAVSGPVPRRPPGLLNFLMETTSPALDAADLSYGTSPTVQYSGNGNAHVNRAISGTRGAVSRPPPGRLFSGIGQLWDAVGLRVGPAPQQPTQRQLPGAAADVAQGLTRLEALLAGEGVSSDMARRLSGNWLVQSRGWGPGELLPRLRGLQRVLAGPDPDQQRAHGAGAALPGLGTEDAEAAGGTAQPRRQRSGGSSGDRASSAVSVALPVAAAAAGVAAVKGWGTLVAAAAAVVKQPNLLTRDLAALEANLEALATTLRISMTDAQSLARTYPSLLELRASLLTERLVNLSQALGLEGGAGASGGCASDAYEEGGEVGVAEGDGVEELGAPAESLAAAGAGVALHLGQHTAWERDGGIRRAACLVRRYPPALALTPAALSARVGALAEAIAASMQRHRQQQQQQHANQIRVPGEPERLSASPPNGVLTTSSSSIAAAAVSAVTNDDAHRAAAAVRTMELVWKQPGLLGYSPDALAARWRALEEAVALAESQLIEPGRTADEDCAGQSATGCGPEQPEPRPNWDLDHPNSRGPGAPTRGAMLRPLAWRRQLLEGPPASVARCLASSAARLRRLAFLVSAEGVAGSGTAVRPRGRPRKTTNAVLQPSLPLKFAIEPTASAAAVAVPGLTAGSRGIEAIGVDEVVDVPAVESRGMEDAADMRSLSPLSLSTILGMSEARFHQRFPGFRAWLLQQP